MIIKKKLKLIIATLIDYIDKLIKPGFKLTLQTEKSHTIEIKIP